MLYEQKVIVTEYRYLYKGQSYVTNSSYVVQAETEMINIFFLLWLPAVFIMFAAELLLCCYYGRLM